MKESRFITKTEAAAYCRVSGRFLDYQRADGNLPFIQLGTRVLFDVRELDRFMEARVKQGTTALDNTLTR